MYMNDEHHNPDDNRFVSENHFNTAPQKPKRNKKGFSAGLVALTLSVALFGGLIGGVSTGYFFSQKNAAATPVAYTAPANESTPNFATTIAATSSKTINSVYETYKSAVVGVKNNGTSTNVFGQTTESASSGTGFIISADGYIITNNHVIEGANKVTVTLFSGDSYEATIVGADTDNDVALLKINATGLNTVKIGNSDNLVVGETIFAIGNPLGELTYTVTAGIVSAEDRAINENGMPINMFQTDVAINPGNSGGPIFNLDGEVVGISTAKYASANIEGIGFAIPINDAVKVANQLKTTGHVTARPYLGVSVSDVSNMPNNTTGLTKGIYVAAVDPNGGASKGGIQKGDVITKIDSKDIKATTDLTLLLKSHVAGDTVKVTVYRNSQYVTLSVTLTENKPNI